MQTVRFDDGTVFLDRLRHPFLGTVPFYLPLVLRVEVVRPESVDFLLMLFEVKLLVVVSVARNCPRDIVGKQRSHNFNTAINITLHPTKTITKIRLTCLQHSSPICYYYLYARIRFSLRTQKNPN